MGVTSLAPVGDSSLYVETSKKNFGDNVYVSWERTNIIQFTNKTFLYDRFSILTNV